MNALLRSRAWSRLCNSATREMASHHRLQDFLYMDKVYHPRHVSRTGVSIVLSLKHQSIHESNTESKDFVVNNDICGGGWCLHQANC